MATPTRRLKMERSKTCSSLNATFNLPDGQEIEIENILFEDGSLMDLTNAIVIALGQADIRINACSSVVLTFVNGVEYDEAAL